MSNESPSAAPSTARRALTSVFWALARMYALLVLAVYLLQGKLLYLPRVETLAQTQARANMDQLSLWPQQAAYQGLLSAAPSESQGVVVLFHGNAGTASDREFYARYLAQCGLRTLLVEYPGYGARVSSELSQNALGIEGAAIILAAKKQFNAPIYVMGESLGSGVAAQAVGRVEASAPGTVAALVLITPWDELASPAQARFWFLPVRWMLHDAYDSVASLQHVRAPLVLVRAQEDELIPGAATQKLFASYQGPKTLLDIPGGHVSWLTNTDAHWWQELGRAIMVASSSGAH